MPDDAPAKIHVAKILDTYAADQKRRQDRIRRLQDQGYRVVDGGQAGPPDADGASPWRVADWRTGRELLIGRSGPDGYDAAVADADPAGTWIHIDRVFADDEDEFTDPPATDGVPASLAEALRDWVESPATPDSDIAAWLGRDIDDVRARRS